jgi:hypothetical protein
MTLPYVTGWVVLNFLKNESNSSGGKRSASVPSGVRKLNMVPLTDVYGTEAPLRSTPGLALTSFSYNASVATEIEGFAFGFGISPSFTA